jgi:hypothetical protein
MMIFIRALLIQVIYTLDQNKGPIE